MHEYQALTIAEVRQETADAISVAFFLPDELRAAFAWRPGQHLAVRTILEGEEVRRTYSICSARGESGLRIAIKRLRGGRFSAYASEHFRPGLTIEALPPSGRFQLPADLAGGAHLLALAAGVGITPIVAMIEHALAAEPAARFTLVYGNPTPAAILFRQRLEDLKDRHLDRFTLLHVLSRSGEDVPELFQGRIDAGKIRRMARPILQLESVAHAFLCGPGTMIRDARAALLELGLPRERIHHEFFAAGAGAYRAPAVSPDAATPAAAHAEVTAILDGVRHRFRVAPGESVVGAALGARVPLPYSCRGGMCSTCRAKVLEGRAEMAVNYALEPSELDKGFILTCQARPLTDRLLLDYDAV